MKLKNKVVIITWASRWIGKSTALLFAKEWACIVVNYFSSEKEAKIVVNEIKKLGSNAVEIKCDVSNEDEVKKMINYTMNYFWKIDILINNAWIVYRSDFKNNNIEKWKQLQNINVLWTLLCSKYVSEKMLKNNIWRIVNISSTNWINSFFPRTMAYDVSKAGINILTRDLAKELAPNILVNAVAPGWVKTTMWDKLTKNFIKKESENIYLKRFAKPEEIAKVILFFASEDSSYVTWSILKVDGWYD